jgi:hypothetical protein
MTSTSIFIGVIVAVLGIAWFIMPFFRRKIQSNDHSTEERLLVLYEQVIATLRDLEEDFGTGKLDEAEYQEEREAWLARGATLLEAMGETPNTHTVQPSFSEAPETLDDIDAAIESAVAKALQRA